MSKKGLSVVNLMGDLLISRQILAELCNEYTLNFKLSGWERANRIPSSFTGSKPDLRKA